MSIRLEGISVKDYAAEHHVSEQSVYAKIKRKEKELQGHITKTGGVHILDVYAQDILMPSIGNSKLSIKVDELTSALARKTEEAEKYKYQLEHLMKNILNGTLANVVK